MEKEIINDTLDLSVWLKGVVENEIMGPILDYARMGDMGDRQFDQFKKTTKATVRAAYKKAVLLLSEYKNFSVDLSVLEKPEQPTK